MKKLLCIFFVLLFSFCSKKEQSPYPQFLVSEQDDVIQVNTKEMLGVRPNMFGWNFTNGTDDTTHIYQPYEKVIDIKKEKRPIYGGWALNENYIKLPFAKDTVIPRMDLKVIVDTTYTISRKSIHYKNYYYPKWNKSTLYSEESEEKLMASYRTNIKKLEDNFVECYPVLIYNNSRNNAVTGTFMIQEAKDSDGKWKPIEFIKRLGIASCIPSPSPLLFSKKYMGSSIIKYHGDFKTKLRVKFANKKNIYYSNEFTGYIHKSQFDNKPYVIYYNRNLSNSLIPVPFEISKNLDFLDYDSNQMINWHVDP
ncbi:hypothetical protein [Flavobacterium sp. 102]|uniref:hypothetical protein n=1 Tax=Flavobacterium sp. 102 TaxID=2135623 RepID=UPI000F205258|nr:hypothetical protein [Flavobacterium sp. 102]RKS01416.1 hypothetical protein C8C84_1072 [Flavobacterium sp. 102]